MGESWTWEDMITEFRALGGVADNVELRDGIYGLGLFPIDAARPVDLHIPDTMVIPTEHVHSQGDDLVVSAESGKDPRVRAFFTRYQRHFSWGVQARADVEAFRRQYADLPDELLQALAGIGIEISRPLGSKWEPLELFKMTRAISYRGNSIFMPVTDLANHTRDARGFDLADGVRIAGTFPGEVFVHYGPADSLGRYFSQQFVSDEVAVFSLAINIPVGAGGKTLIIGRRFGEKQTADQRTLLPVVREEGDNILLTHVMLGNDRFPRLPRTLFRRALPALPVELADELFQRIVSTNMLSYLQLLDTLDRFDAEPARQLRQVTRLQLKGIARSYGALDAGAFAALSSAR